MLAPAMATMLVVLTTDAVADAATWTRRCARPPRATFDRLDVDGGTSTNDTVLLLASGASGISPGAEELTEAVRAACTDLCLQLQADAEGVTKHVTIAVARRAAPRPTRSPSARTVAQDNLVQDRVLRRRPQLGAHRDGRRPRPGEVDADAARHHDQRRRDVPRRRGRRATGTPPTCRAATSRRRSSSGSATAPPTILTTDLSHAYVEENRPTPHDEKLARAAEKAAVAGRGAAVAAALPRPGGGGQVRRQRDDRRRA